MDLQHHTGIGIEVTSSDTNQILRRYPADLLEVARLKVRIILYLERPTERVCSIDDALTPKDSERSQLIPDLVEFILRDALSGQPLQLVCV